MALGCVTTVVGIVDSNNKSLADELILRRYNSQDDGDFYMGEYYLTKVD